MHCSSADKLKLLSLGYCFPPVASAEAYVSARILGNIPNSLIDHIGAEASLISGRVDSSLDAYIRDRFNAVKTIEALPFISYLNDKFPSMPFRPDRWVMLNRATYKKAVEMNPNNYDAYITRSQYHSIHLVGYKLKQKFPSLPWVACFSDPWSGADHSRNVPFFSRWSAKMECDVLKTADTLVFPTEGLAEYFDRQNPNADVLSKAHIIPHTIDPQLTPDTPNKQNNEDTLIGRCLGSFYGPRRVAPLLKGLRALLENYPEYKRKIKIELIGANQEVNDQISLYNLNDYIKVVPSVDWSEAMNLMKQSNFLVLVEAPSNSPSFYMPSKLIDYISTEKPIFAISPNGCSSEIVQAAGGIVVAPDQSSLQIAQALNSVTSITVNTNLSKEFDVKIHGERVAKIITSLIETYKTT